MNYKWLRIAFYVFNTLWMVLSLSALIWGIVVAWYEKAKPNSSFPGVPRNDDAVALRIVYAITTLGAISIVIAVCGYFGIYLKHKIVSIVYASLTTIVCIVILIMLLFFGFKLYKNKFYFFVDFVDSENDYYNYLNNSILNTYTGSTYIQGQMNVTRNLESQQWDETHQSLSCCGLKSYKNFESSKTWKKIYKISNTSVVSKIPASCCRLRDPDKFPDSPKEIVFTKGEECILKATKDSAYLDGCWDKLKDEASLPAKMMIAFGVLCVVIILICIILSLIIHHYTYYDNTVDIVRTKENTDDDYAEILNESIYSVHRGPSSYYAHSDYSGQIYKPNKSLNNNWDGRGSGNYYVANPRQ